MIEVTWGSASDRGRVRPVNEDSLLASPTLFVVADGMGGHAAGDVASQLAVDGLTQLLDSDPIGVPEVLEAIDEANLSIVNRAAASEERAGMGTTIAGVAVVEVGGIDHWMVFNMGDSRVYRMIDDELIQVTVDHSEAQEMVASGQLTLEEARTYRRRNVVTRSLGIDPPDAVDTWVFPPVPGERFLLCSDGLTTEVDEGAIRTFLERIDDPQEAAQVLVRAAIDAGGSDNVTVVVIDHRATDASDVDENTVPRRIGGA